MLSTINIFRKNKRILSEVPSLVRNFWINLSNILNRFNPRNFIHPKIYFKVLQNRPIISVQSALWSISVSHEINSKKIVIYVSQ